MSKAIDNRNATIAISDGKFDHVAINWDSPPPTLVTLTRMPLGDFNVSHVTTVTIPLSELEDLVRNGTIHMIEIGDGLEDAAAILTVPQPPAAVPRQFAGSPVEPFFRDGQIFMGADFERRRIRNSELAKRAATKAVAKAQVAERAVAAAGATVAAAGSRSDYGTRGAEALLGTAGRVSDVGAQAVPRSQTFNDAVTAKDAIDGSEGPVGTDLSTPPQSSRRATFPESRRTERDRRDAGFWRVRSRSATS